MASKVYIPHDSNARNSKKMLRMREKLGPTLGPAAYGIYWMLIERLRDEDCYVSDKDYEMLVFDLRCDKELLRQVVEDFGLFDIAEDGETFASHGLKERMAVMEEKSSARSEAGKKGAAARWQNHIKNPNEMAQNGKNMANAESVDSTIINELNKKEINNSSSKSSSFDNSEEEEKENIIAYFTFCRNWAAPNAEYAKLIAFYNAPGRSKSWAKMKGAEKTRAISKWIQEPERPLRFEQDFLDMWKKVYDALRSIAPANICSLALADTIRGEAEDGKYFLYVPAELHYFIENNLDTFKPVLWPFIRSKGYGRLKYRHV